MVAHEHKIERRVTARLGEVQILYRIAFRWMQRPSQKPSEWMKRCRSQGEPRRAAPYPGTRTQTQEAKGLIQPACRELGHIGVLRQLSCSLRVNTIPQIGGN